MLKILQKINAIMPERIKFKILKFYRAMPFCLPHVLLHPSFDCNYNCHYCTNKRYLDSIVSSAIFSFDKWVKAFECFPRSTITISGGEPLLYPGLSSLLLGLSRRHLISQVVSNLSLDLKPLFDAKKAGFRIMASYHPDYANLDEFTAKVIELRDGGFSIFVNCVGSLDNLNKVEELSNFFNKKLNIFFKVDVCEEAVIDDAKVYLGRNINTPIYGFNTYVDKRIYDRHSHKICTGGSKFFVVIADGGVYRCNGGFKYCNMTAYKGLLNNINEKDFYMGNVLWGDYKIDKKQFHCYAPCKSTCDVSFAAARVRGD
jgi:sulfatase maturation enzyme AslB (radical SAM superfamily)